jgi:hypothetical protein
MNSRSREHSSRPSPSKKSSQRQDCAPPPHHGKRGGPLAEKCFETNEVQEVKKEASEIMANADQGTEHFIA